MKIDYNKIGQNLNTINRFIVDNPNSNISKKLILSSYLFARLSIRTLVSIHEKDFKIVSLYLKDFNYDIINEEILELIIGKQLRNSKINDIIPTFKTIKRYNFNVLSGKNIKEIITQLRNDNVFHGLGFVKIAFVIEMLGFNAGCLDSHMIELLNSKKLLINRYSKVKRNGKRYKIYTNGSNIGQSLSLYLDNLNQLMKFPEYKKYNNIALTQWELWNNIMNKKNTHEVYFDVVKDIMDGE